MLRHYKNTYETAQAETGQRQCGNQWPKSMRCAKNTGWPCELFKRFSCPEVAVWQWDDVPSVPQFHMQFSSGLLQAIKGMTLSAAKQYLQDVCDKKRHRRKSRSQADVSLS